MKTINLQVSGMTCGNCVKHVDRAIRAIPGVQHVQVDLNSGVVLVESDSSTTSASIMIALSEEGYPATESGPIPSNTSTEKTSCCMGQANGCN
jgi:hypothetical protein